MSKPVPRSRSARDNASFPDRLDILLVNLEVWNSRIDGSPRLRRVRWLTETEGALAARRCDAAAAAALAESSFSRDFRRSIGTSYREWLTILRVARAIELLAQHDRALSWVAWQSGLGTLRTLERAFRRYLGTTPRECQRALLESQAASAAMPR